MTLLKTNPVEQPVLNEQRSYVTFRLLQQMFALPIEPIAQIVEMVRVTSLPQCPTSVKGVINWHGVLVPVLDLSAHLGDTNQRFDWRAHVILVEYEGHYLGLIVDEVLDVIQLSRQQIARPTDVFPVELSDKIYLIDGLARTDSQLLLLLDLPQLFMRSTLNLAELTADLTTALSHGPETEIAPAVFAPA